jgi:hypothetical protein
MRTCFAAVHESGFGPKGDITPPFCCDAVHSARTKILLNLRGSRPRE